MLQKIYVSQVIINNNVAEVAQLVSDGKEGEGSQDKGTPDDASEKPGNGSGEPGNGSEEPGNDPDESGNSPGKPGNGKT